MNFPSLYPQESFHAIFYSIRSVNRTSQAELTSSQPISAAQSGQVGAKADTNGTAVAGKSLPASSLSYANRVTISQTNGEIDAQVGSIYGSLSQRTSIVSTANDVSAAQSGGTSLNSHSLTTASVTDIEADVKGNDVLGFRQASVGFTNDQAQSISVTPGNSADADPKITVASSQNSSVVAAANGADFGSHRYGDGGALIRISTATALSASSGNQDLALVAAQADPAQRALTSIGAGTSVSETEKSVWDQSFYAFTVRVNGVERDFWVADITRSASTSVSQSALTGVASQTSNSSGLGADGRTGVQNGSLILGANNSASVSASQRSIVISNGFEPIFAFGGSMYLDRDSLLDPTPWDKRWWGNDRTPYDSNEAAERLAQASSTTLTISNPGDNTTVDLGDYDLVIPAAGVPHLVDNKPRKAAEKLAKITPEVIAKRAAALTRVSGSDEIKLSRENLALSLFTHASNRYLGTAENSQRDKTGTGAGSTISPSFAGSGVVAGRVPVSKTVLPDNVAAVLAPISVTVVA